MNAINHYYNIVLSNPAILGIALIFLSVISAKCVDIIFSFIFKRLVNKTKTSLDDQMLALLHRPIFYSVLLIGFIFSIKTASLPDYIEFTFIGICKTITIVIWFFVAPKILLISMEWASKKTKSPLLQKNTVPLFNNLGKIAIGIMGTYFIFLSWEININGILASAGVLGVVLGLAAKDTVSNFFAGIFLLADAPFKEGDYILLETGERGFVKQMGLRSTRFMTRDDIEIIIPNSVIATSKIVNESGGPEEIERVRITLLVSYSSDIDEVKKILVEIAKHNENVLDKPEPRVRLREFAENGLRLQLLFWILKPEIRGKTVDIINTEIYKKFNEKNIVIPYPVMELVLPNK